MDNINKFYAMCYIIYNCFCLYKSVLDNIDIAFDKFRDLSIQKCEAFIHPLFHDIILYTFNIVNKKMLSFNPIIADEFDDYCFTINNINFFLSNSVMPGNIEFDFTIKRESLPQLGISIDISDEKDKD